MLENGIIIAFSLPPPSFLFRYTPMRHTAHGGGHAPATSGGRRLWNIPAPSSIPFESVGPPPGLKLQLDRSSSLEQTSALNTLSLSDLPTQSFHNRSSLDRPSDITHATYTQPTTTASSTAGTRTRTSTFSRPTSEDRSQT